jgi:hypothetical protein
MAISAIDNGTRGLSSMCRKLPCWGTSATGSLFMEAADLPLTPLPGCRLNSILDTAQRREAALSASCIQYGA